MLALRVSYDALVSCLRIGGDRHQVRHFDLPSELGNGHPGILLQESRYLDIYFTSQKLLMIYIYRESLSLIIHNCKHILP